MDIMESLKIKLEPSGNKSEEEFSLESRLFNKMEEMVKKALEAVSEKKKNSSNINNNSMGSPFRDGISSGVDLEEKEEYDKLDEEIFIRKGKSTVVTPQNQRRKNEEEIGVILDGSEVSNKRTANEIAVLDKILELADR